MFKQPITNHQSLHDILAPQTFFAEESELWREDPWGASLKSQEGHSSFFLERREGGKRQREGNLQKVVEGIEAMKYSGKGAFFDSALRRSKQESTESAEEAGAAMLQEQRGSALGRSKQGSRDSAKEAGAAMMQPGQRAGFLEPDAFARVLDFLNLEDVARLMMCSRSLREMGAGRKEWALAVDELSSKKDVPPGYICSTCRGTLDRASCKGPGWKAREEEEREGREGKPDRHVCKCKWEMRDVGMDGDENSRDRCCDFAVVGDPRVELKMGEIFFDVDREVTSTNVECRSSLEQVSPSNVIENASDYTFVFVPDQLDFYNSNYKVIYAQKDAKWEDFLFAVESKLGREVESIKYRKDHSNDFNWNGDVIHCKTEDDWQVLMAMMEHDVQSVDRSFGFLPPHVQFGKLFQFQRDSINDLAKCVGYADLNVRRPQSDYITWTSPLRDMWLQVEQIDRECPSRYDLLNEMVQMSDNADWPDWVQMLCVEGIDDHLESDYLGQTLWRGAMVELCTVYNLAQTSGERFCSDENLRQVRTPHKSAAYCSALSKFP